MPANQDASGSLPRVIAERPQSAVSHRTTGQTSHVYVFLCPAARDNMLMRFAKVTSEGKYVPPPPANSKASFSTMVYVRATIVEDAGEYLARAVTIAVSGPSAMRCTCRPLTLHRFPSGNTASSWCFDMHLLSVRPCLCCGLLLL